MYLLVLRKQIATISCSCGINVSCIFDAYEILSIQSDICIRICLYCDNNFAYKYFYKKTYDGKKFKHFYDLLTVHLLLFIFRMPVSNHTN